MFGNGTFVRRSTGAGSLRAYIDWQVHDAVHFGTCMLLEFMAVTLMPVTKFT